MSIWDDREKSIDFMNTNYLEQKNFIDALYQTIDDCIDICEKETENQYLRMCGLTMIKAKNYSVAMYSVILDGLAQESGALLRSFIETIELLTYFREDPSRIDQVAKKSLPSAEERTQQITIDFKELRNRLNIDAPDHYFNEYLINKDGPFKKIPEFSEIDLRKHLGLFYRLLLILESEAIAAIAVHHPNISYKQRNALVRHREEALKLFDLKPSTD